MPKNRRRRRVAASHPRPLPPMAINHVWAYDFVFDTCANGRSLKCLTVIDEFTRSVSAIDVAGGIRSGASSRSDAARQPHGAPQYLRSDNGLPQKSRRQSFSDLTRRSARMTRTRIAKRFPPSRNHTLTIVTQGQATSGAALTRLHRALHSRWKVRALSTRSQAPRRPVAKGSSRLVSSLPGSDDSRCRW